MASFSFLILLLLLLLLPHQAFASPSFSPPPGNSIAIRALAQDGKQIYRCDAEGGWEPLYKTATLRDAKNQSIIIGYYASRHEPNHSLINAGTWSLINSDGDQAESGHPTSLVAGKQLVVVQNGDNNLTDFLAQASLHRYDGAAARVSYIAQLNSTLSSPLSSHCGAEKSTLSIGFKAMYVFWRQDLVPPRVPNSLSVPELHRPVEAFFGQGVVKYIFDRHLQVWTQRKVLARLYDVPGGAQVGGYSYNITLSISNSSQEHHHQQQQDGDDLACITIDDPNGFRVCGTQGATPVTVTSSSLPWSLFLITNNTGNMASILGPFTFAQMVSTRGGLLPPNLNTTNSTNHQVWRSSFTAIFWLYTNRGN